MRYTVLNVAYPFSAVNTDTVGGAEQVLLAIESQLAEYGIDSIVIAKSGSHVNGKLEEITVPDGEIGDNEKKEVAYQVKKVIKNIVNQYHPDLIHFHGVDVANYLEQYPVPSLVTLHLPVNHYRLDLLQMQNVYVNCVSSSQDSTLFGFKNKLKYIENGVGIPLNVKHIGKQSYALCIGRVCPEKGFHLAIQAAKKAKAPLYMAGEVFPYFEHVNYFERCVQPNIDSVNCHFIGKIGGEKKMMMLENAKCVLIPSCIEETSSLVAMEALAHGTPVIAFNAGALKDIVQHGINGFLVNDTDEMCEAIRIASLISPDVCHKFAADRYDKNRMVKEYIDMYMNIIERNQML